MNFNLEFEFHSYEQSFKLFGMAPEKLGIKSSQEEEDLEQNTDKVGFC